MSADFEPSDLTKIDISRDNPFDLFQTWHEKSRNAGVPIPDMFNFATSDGCGRVSSRNLILRQLDKDGFVFMTDGRSKKSFDLAKCPRAAMTFIWIIPEPSQILQVRIEGEVKRESFQDYEDVYVDEPLYCKIRSMFCRQGEYVDWDEHKKLHDEMYENAKKKESWKQSKPPPHYVAYKMYPEMIEFFAANDESTADRVVFRRSNDACIPAQVLQQLEKTKEAILTSNVKNDSKAQRKDSKENGIQNDQTKKVGTKMGYQMHTAKNDTNGKNYGNTGGKNTDNYYDEEALRSTFNNSLKIQVGVEKLVPKSSEQKWIYYRIAA